MRIGAGDGNDAAFQRLAHRLKHGTDYSILWKYDKCYVMCFEPYKTNISAIMADYGIEPEDWFLIT